ncbi:unnamed protein product [Caenorhabditis bovis]|uniref:BZIP domain-containing protein n=1 Tax=Caenorhabditis bovis TaxID=2654633 RepID=A0A8S1EZG6_9PELO|nr:unnamed protein product [Caenorhabditis bovis]
MLPDIQQQIASGIYDTTQQHIRAMSQMWNFDHYQQQPYTPTGCAKEEKFDQFKQEMMFHPLFAHQFTQFATVPPRDSPGPTKKKPQPVPDDQKDESYRERRRRNNEAARKSREARKKNEDLTSRRLEAAQQENFILRQELHRLKIEVESLQYSLARATAQINMGATNAANPPSY